MNYSVTEMTNNVCRDGRVGKHMTIPDNVAKKVVYIFGTREKQIVLFYRTKLQCCFYESFSKFYVNFHKSKNHTKIALKIDRIFANR